MTDQQKYKKGTYHLVTFLISKLMGSLGGSIYAFGMSMFILSMTGSALNFATNMLLSILPRTVLAPFAGVIIDRVPRKLLVVGGQLGIVLTISALLTYSFVFDLSVTAIYAATFFMNIFATFSGGAISASVMNLVDEGRLQKAMSFNQMAYSMSGIGGPVVGGLLFGFTTMETFIIIYLISQIIVLILESTMDFNLYKKPVEQKPAEKQSMMESFKEGMAYIKTKPLLMALLGSTFALNFFFTALSIGGDFTLLTLLHLSTKQIGITEAALAVGLIVASIYFASAKSVKKPLLLSKNSILGMSMLVMLMALPLFLSMSTTGNFIYYIVLMFVFGVMNVMTNMPIGVLFQKSIDDEYKGRVLSILEAMSMSLMPIATIIYGFLFDVLPAEMLFIVSGLCLIVATLYTLRPSIINMAMADETPEQPETDNPSLNEVTIAK